MSEGVLFEDFHPSEELIALLRDFTHECLSLRVPPNKLVSFAKTYFTEMEAGIRPMPDVKSLELGEANTAQPLEGVKANENGYDREQFLIFVNKILEAEDIIDARIVTEAAESANLPLDATQKLIALVQDNERNRDDVIVLAATLASTNFVQVVSLLFQAFAGETGLLPIRDLIDLHQSVMNFKPNDPILVNKYGALIDNYLLSMTFDTTDITFDQFLEIPLVQEYVEKRGN